MKKNPYQYFEVAQKGGFLSDVAYEEAIPKIGRICLDVCFIYDNALVLAKRNNPPMKGLWVGGGRIRWENFNDVYDYANRTMDEHFGITIPTNKMTLLQPRFFCFKERPYPEIVMWVIGLISARQFKNIKLNTTEQSDFFVFKSKKELQLFMKQSKFTPLHCSIIIDLWDELTELGLLAN